MRCLLTRYRVSRALDQGRPLAASAERHVLRCAACAAERSRLVTLHERLLQGADRERVGTPPALEARIRHRVANERPVLLDTSGERPRLGLPALALAGLVLIAVLGVWRSGMQPPDLPGSPPPGPTVAGRATPRLAEPAALAALDQELARLRADARAGVGFVLARGGLGWRP